jgi:hypothetical protein
MIAGRSHDGPNRATRRYTAGGVILPPDRPAAAGGRPGRRWLLRWIVSNDALGTYGAMLALAGAAALALAISRSTGHDLAGSRAIPRWSWRPASPAASASRHSFGSPRIARRTLPASWDQTVSRPPQVGGMIGGQSDEAIRVRAASDTRAGNSRRSHSRRRRRVPRHEVHQQRRTEPADGRSVNGSADVKVARVDTYRSLSRGSACPQMVQDEGRPVVCEGREYD